jgi:hypothetical protein
MELLIRQRYYKISDKKGSEMERKDILNSGRGLKALKGDPNP